MDIKYDKFADAVYMKLGVGKVAKTVEINDRLIVDLDEAGHTFGIEILNASSQGNLVKMLQETVMGGLPITHISESAPISV